MKFNFIQVCKKTYNGIQKVAVSLFDLALILVVIALYSHRIIINAIEYHEEKQGNQILHVEDAEKSLKITVDKDNKTMRFILVPYSPIVTPTVIKVNIDNQPQGDTLKSQ